MPRYIVRDRASQRVAEDAGSAEMDAADDTNVSDFCNGARETENERVPGRDSEMTVKEVLSPKMEARMNAAEPLIEAWAEGYSGKAGVPGLKKSSQGPPTWGRCRSE